MLITDLNFLINHMQNQKFSGHVRIGIEKGSVSSMNKETYHVHGHNNDYDYDEISELINHVNYGKVDLDFSDGRIYDYKVTETYQSEDLTKLVEAKKCRCVKIVVLH